MNQLKNITITVLLFAINLSACHAQSKSSATQNTKQYTITISGQIKGLEQPKEAELVFGQSIPGDGRNEPNSITGKISLSNDGKFSTQVTFTGPTPAVLTMNIISNKFFIEQDFLVEDKDLTIVGTVTEMSEHLSKLHIIGSAIHQEYMEAQALREQLSGTLKYENSTFSQEVESLDKLTREQIRKFWEIEDPDALDKATLQQAIQKEIQIATQAKRVTNIATAMAKELVNQYKNKNPLIAAKLIADFVRHDVEGAYNTLHLEATDAKQMLAELNLDINRTHVGQFSEKVINQVFSVSRGQPFKDFKAFNLERQLVSFSDYVKPGRYTLLMMGILAADDPFDVPELKRLLVAHKKYHSKGLDIIIHRGGSIGDISDLIKKKPKATGVTYLSDHGQEAHHQYCYLEYPDSFLIGPDGKFVHVKMSNFRLYYALKQIFEK